MTDPKRQPIGKGAYTGTVALGTAGVLAFLMMWESSGNTVLTVYEDKLAHNILTVCDGITHHVTDTPIVLGETWTLEKCKAETRRAVIQVQMDLTQCFDRAPPQSVFDAATSHAWNFGWAKTCTSAAMKAWDRGEWQLGCNRLSFADDGRPVWAMAGGKFVRGLHLRRKDETKVCAQFERYKP